MENPESFLSLKGNTISIDNIVALIFSLRAITFVWLAFASNLYMPRFAVMVQFLRYSTIPIGIFYLFLQGRADRDDFKLLTPLVFYYFMLLFHTYEGYRGSYVHELISIGCFLLMPRKIKIKIFHYFYRIILFSCLISIFVYLAYMIHLPIGFSSLPFYNDGVQTSYYQRWLIFAVLDSGFSIPRLCGIFNEPGGLGTVCGLLFAAIFHYSDKWEKAILIVTTIMTFSLAGYILILIYLMIYLGQKSWKYAGIVIALLIFFFMIPQIDWGNEDINAFAQRFAITSGGLTGDNRTKSSFEEEYEKLLDSAEIYFGKGAAYMVGTGTSSYKNYIMQFGVIGFGIYAALWLINAFHVSKGNRECLVLLLTFFLSIYQRPVAFTNAYGYLIIFGGFLWILDQEERNKKVVELR